MIEKMFRYAAEDNLEEIKKLYQAGVPINIKHPYHGGTLAHQAMYTGRQPQASGVCGWSNTSVKVLKWLLEELERRGQLEDILSTKIKCDKSTREKSKGIYSEIVLGLDYDGFVNKTPLEMMQYQHGRGKADIAHSRGSRASPRYGEIKAGVDITEPELDQGLALLKEYAAKLENGRRRTFSYY